MSGQLSVAARFKTARLTTPLTALAVLGLCAWSIGHAGAREGIAIPPAATDEPVASAPTSETAVFAGGCFWGVQGVFQHVAGVTNAVSGYAGGKEADAHYRVVGTGR